MSSRSDQADELGALFVSVTGDDSVIERQEGGRSDRELPADTRVDVEDGLADAVAGADVEQVRDPVE